MSTGRNKSITNFLGVDFSSSPADVDPRRSPDGVNMIVGANGRLRKRTGYVSVCAPKQGKVYGMFPMGEDLYIHCGTKLYLLRQGALTLIAQDIATAVSSGFIMGGALYLLDGVTYRRVQGTQSSPVRSIAYFPMVKVGASPDGKGTVLESPNCLTAGRRMSYRGDGTSTYYYVDGPIAPGTTVSVTVGGVAQSNITVTYGLGRVAFAAPPPKATEEDNVVITYTGQEGATGEMDQCTCYGIYGGGGDTRVFLTGNPAKKNTDWHSGLMDPTYFPKNGYTCIGSDDAPIIGYIRQYDSQIIVKGDGSGGATHYLRTWGVDSNGNAYFPVAQGADGSGGVAQRTLVGIMDQPMYLSEDGVCSWSISSITSQRSISPRSNRINRRLMAEEELKNAFALGLGGKYYLFVGNSCYVGDLLQMSEDGSGFGQYEWYYLTDIPAVCGCVKDGTIWFGTGDGRVCRFFTEDETDAYTDEGKAIAAKWTTSYMDLGSDTRKKTIKGVYMTMCPRGASSGADISIGTENTYGQQVGTVDLLRLEFGDLDFNRFTFRCVNQPQTLYFPVRIFHAGFVQVSAENRENGACMELAGIGFAYELSRKIR